MNVPFVTGDEELDALFVKESKAAGFENLKGHRTVGGMRASIYNAMPAEGVGKLVEFMADFEKKHRHVMKFIRLVGLEGFEKSFPAELSGGMKQRVEFARALAVDPDVLYLDEPFGALDAFTRIEMRREIVRIWRETKKTCILVTHDVEEALELADRVAVMTRRPATIHSVIDNPMARPRDCDTDEFRDRKHAIFKILGVERKV